MYNKDETINLITLSSKINLQDSRSLHPESLGIYLGQPAVDNFNVIVAKSTKKVDNIEEIGFHVVMTSKMSFARDARMAVIYDLGPKLDAYLESNDFSLD